MVSEAWLLVVIGLACASLLMLLVWLLALRLRDASYVDVAWALGIAGAALLYAFLADGAALQRVLVAGLGTVWGVRLGTYLLFRLAGQGEDGRYRELRARWGARASRNFFLFFQAQAAFVAVFSVPLALVAVDRDELHPVAWAGAALAALSIAGEVAADAQLAVWRAEPANRGKTARTGLWNLSRHPNYFFEWLHWVGWALIALGSPWGWVALAVPAFLLYLLVFVTGIPAAEEQALRSRGEDYRRYQREVSAFVPWFPKRAG
jgi:steroid 5-alpha reductase family enzyme